MSFPALRLAGVLFAAAIMLAAPAAFAQTYVIHRSFTGAGGVTGTATLEMANSTLGDWNFFASNSVPAELVSATLTFNNLGGVPVSTTFNRSHLNGLYFNRSSGVIADINFWASNPDGYSLVGTAPFVTSVGKGGYAVSVTNAETAPVAVPTLTEWALIGFALALAGGAALMIQRRRVVSV